MWQLKSPCVPSKLEVHPIAKLLNQLQLLFRQTAAGFRVVVSTSLLAHEVRDDFLAREAATP